MITISKDGNTENFRLDEKFLQYQGFFKLCQKDETILFGERKKTNKPSSVSFISYSWTEKKSLPKYFQMFLYDRYVVNTQDFPVVVWFHFVYYSCVFTDVSSVILVCCNAYL